MSINSNSYSISNREIAYNLSIMEQTIKKGGEVDKGFIEIFAQDIQMLGAQQADTSSTQNLKSRLIQIRRDMTTLATNVPKTLQTGPKRGVDAVSQQMQQQPSGVDLSKMPLVGKLTSLKKIAESYTPGNVKTGLEKLDVQLEMLPMRGDGHCLFRAVGSAIMQKYVDKSPEEQKLFLDKLADNLFEDKIFDKELDITFRNFKKILNKIAKDLKENPHLKDQVIYNEKDSNQVVAFLRRAVCHYNRNRLKADREFGKNIEAEDQVGGMGKYLTDMADMNQAKYGGAPELQALATLLDVDITVYDVRAAGEGKANFTYVYSGSGENNSGIHLLLRPGHYDLGVPK